MPSGEVAATHWYVGANIFVAENPDILGYVTPKKGATMFQEDICVLKSTPNYDNAFKFMAYYLKPEIAALNVEQQKPGTPNLPAEALIPPEFAGNATIFPGQAVLDKLQIFEKSEPRSSALEQRMYADQNRSIAARSTAQATLLPGCKRVAHILTNQLFQALPCRQLSKSMVRTRRFAAPKGPL